MTSFLEPGLGFTPGLFGNGIKPTEFWVAANVTTSGSNITTFNGQTNNLTLDSGNGAIASTASSLTSAKFSNDIYAGIGLDLNEFLIVACFTSGSSTGLHLLVGCHASDGNDGRLYLGRNGGTLYADCGENENRSGNIASSLIASDNELLIIGIKGSEGTLTCQKNNETAQTGAFINSTAFDTENVGAFRSGQAAFDDDLHGLYLFSVNADLTEAINFVNDIYSAF